MGEPKAKLADPENDEIPDVDESEVLEQSCIDGFTKAYVRNPLNLYEVFSRDLADFITKEALRKESPVEMAVVLLLDAMSYMLSPDSGFLPTRDESYEIPCNVYVIGLCQPGTGKSQIFRLLVNDPVTKLETDWKWKQDRRICLRKTTPAAVAKGLGKGHGRLLFINDEMCHMLETVLDRRASTCSEMRMTLNELWTGGSFRKDFASKKGIDIQKTYFSIGGTMHPGYLQRVFDVLGGPDGLIDRFFFLACNPKSQPPLPENFDMERFDKIPPGDDWAWMIYEAVDFIHNTERSKKDRRVYYPDEKGAADLKSNKKEDRERQDDRVRSHEDQIKKELENPGTSRSLGETLKRLAKVPVAQGDTKDADQTGKTTVALHVLEHLFAELKETGECGKMEIPLEINSLTVERASYLVSTMREQIKEYKDALRTFAIIRPSLKQQKGVTVENAAKKQVVKEREPVERRLATYPGKFFNSQMFTRKSSNRDCKAQTVNVKMRELSRDPGQNGFFGKYKKIGNRTCFFKAPWDKIDQDFMTNVVSVTEEEYKSAYAHTGLVTDVSGIDQSEILKFLEEHKFNFCV